MNNHNNQVVYAELDEMSSEANFKSSTQLDSY
jgi:hypothetical protein